MKRQLTSFAMAVLVGCSPSTQTTPEAITRTAALQSFAGPNACADLEAYIEDTASKMMRSQLEAQRDSWLDYANGRNRGVALGGIAEDVASESAPSASASAGDASSAAPPAAPNDFTTTNNQVANVDEADFMKNDGTRIFALSGNALHAVKSWPANEAATLGKIEIDGWPRELFLDGDRAIVFSTIYKWYPLDQQVGDCSSLKMSCGYYNANTVKATVIDVSNMASMKKISEYELPGHYNSARKIGASVRLVLSDNFRFPAEVQFYVDYDQADFPQNGPPNYAAIAAKYDALIVKNEKLIRQQTLGGWMPSATLKDANGEASLGYDCGDFSKVNAPTKLGTLSVVTLNLEKQTIDQATIVSEAGEIYASAKNLYLATRHWWWWSEIGQADATYVHKFDISSPDAATYVASGTIDGHIVDQFSMDENADGFFRIVTTTNTRVADTVNPQNTWGRIETANHLFVYAEDSGVLKLVGQTPPLAVGERVMSSRLIGNKGFVVTFRQIDPLFTFDLSDPTNPKQVGELKIPGFSTYIHPLDDTHLLTIGTYVPAENTDWRARALQLQIFDVSDLSNPTLTHTQLVGTAYGWSEAQYEHKAFNYFPAKKLLAIPFSDWSYGDDNQSYWTSFKSELRVYGVDAAAGFTSKGTLSMTDLYQARNSYNWTYYWTPSVRRSVMADDYVYAVTDAGVRVANINNLASPIATAEFSLSPP